MNTASTLKYDFLNRLLWVMGNTVALLAVASIYSQTGFDSFLIHPVFAVSFILTRGSFLLMAVLLKGFLNYFLERFKVYGKTPFAVTMSLLCLTSLLTRFFLPNEIIHYVQTAFYVAAGVFLISGILYLIRKR